MATIIKFPTSTNWSLNSSRAGSIRSHMSRIDTRNECVNAMLRDKRLALLNDLPKTPQTNLDLALQQAVTLPEAQTPLAPPQTCVIHKGQPPPQKNTTSTTATATKIKSTRRPKAKATAIPNPFVDLPIPQCLFNYKYIQIAYPAQALTETKNMFNKFCSEDDEQVKNQSKSPERELMNKLPDNGFKPWSKC